MPGLLKASVWSYRFHRNDRLGRSRTRFDMRSAYIITWTSRGRSSASARFELHLGQHLAEIPKLSGEALQCTKSFRSLTQGGCFAFGPNKSLGKWESEAPAELFTRQVRQEPRPCILLASNHILMIASNPCSTVFCIRMDYETTYVPGPYTLARCPTRRTFK